MWLTPHLRDPQPEGERENRTNEDSPVLSATTL